MLCQGPRHAEQEVIQVLRWDGPCGDGRACGLWGGQGFDARPGQIDVEEREEDC